MKRMVILDVALSLGIGVYAVALVVFIALYFVMGPEKRWMNAVPCLACLVGLFTFLFALSDNPSVAYVGFGVYRGLFEVQRALFLRIFLGPSISIFWLIFVANAFGTYTYDAAMFPTVVAFSGTVVAYLLAFLMLWMFNRMKDAKETRTLLVSVLYASAVILIFSLSDAIFDVMSPSLEFFLYVPLDVLFLIVPAVLMAFAFRYEDEGYDPFMNIDRRQGAEDGFLYTQGAKRDTSLPHFDVPDDDLPRYYRGMSPADIARAERVLNPSFAPPDEL